MILQNRNMQSSQLSIRHKVLVIFISIVLIFVVDQATKFWAVNSLMGKPSVEVFGKYLQFVYAENAGAFLGFGGGWSREVRFFVFALFVFFGLGGMFWYLIKRENLKVNLYAYSFILAGGFGNLWDRVFHEDGHVVDFLLIEVYGPLRTGVFNIADIFIVIGVLLALLGEYIFNKNSNSTNS